MTYLTTIKADYMQILLQRSIRVTFLLDCLTTSVLSHSCFLVLILGLLIWLLIMSLVWLLLLLPRCLLLNPTPPTPLESSSRALEAP
jgi:hypothetical protein